MYKWVGRMMCRGGGDRTWSGDMPLVGVNYITDYITNSISPVMRHQLPVHQQPYINEICKGRGNEEDMREIEIN